MTDAPTQPPPIPLAWPPQGWRCPSCHCPGYVHMGEFGPDGHYHSGPNIRCAECKREWYAPTPIPLVAGELEAVARIIDPEAWEQRLACLWLADNWLTRVGTDFSQQTCDFMAKRLRMDAEEIVAPSLAKAERIVTLLAHIKAGEPK